jgi:uncharacterized protein YgiM (DUF1202 family)
MDFTPLFESEDLTPEVVEETENTELGNDLPPKVEEKTKMGTVTGCVQLNIRRRPRIDASIICQVNSGTKVIIDEEKSTEDFCKVYTEAGIEGFCMRKYITVE